MVRNYTDFIFQPWPLADPQTRCSHGGARDEEEGFSAKGEGCSGHHGFGSMLLKEPSEAESERNPERLEEGWKVL